MPCKFEVDENGELYHVYHANTRDGSDPVNPTGGVEIEKRMFDELNADFETARKAFRYEPDGKGKGRLVRKTAQEIRDQHQREKMKDDPEAFIKDVLPMCKTRVTAGILEDHYQKNGTPRGRPEVDMADPTKRPTGILRRREAK